MVLQVAEVAMFGEPAAPTLLLAHELTEPAAAQPDAVAGWPSRITFSRWTCGEECLVITGWLVSLRLP